MGFIYYDEFSEFGPEQIKFLQEYIDGRWKHKHIMDEKEICKMLELIEEFVGEDGSWREKRQRLHRLADSDQETALEEFASWFDGNE